MAFHPTEPSPHPGVPNTLPLPPVPERIGPLTKSWISIRAVHPQRARVSCKRIR